MDLAESQQLGVSRGVAGGRGGAHVDGEKPDAILPACGVEERERGRDLFRGVVLNVPFAGIHEETVWDSGGICGQVFVEDEGGADVRRVGGGEKLEICEVAVRGGRVVFVGLLVDEDLFVASFVGGSGTVREGRVWWL